MPYLTPAYKINANLGTEQDPFQFTYYNVNKNSLFSFKFDRANKFTLVGTATVTVRSDSQPVSANANSVYADENTEAMRPLATQSSEYLRITASAINSGVRSIGTLDVTGYSHVVLVDKSATASVVGKLKISSTAGTAESVCVFTTSSVANTWIGGFNDTAGVAHIFPFKATSAGEGVTITGTPNYALANIELTLDVASNIDAFEVYFIKAREQAIGVEYVRPYGCISGMTPENSVEYVNVLCNNLIAGLVATGRTQSLKLETNEQSLSQMATEEGSFVEFALMPTRKTPVLYTVTAGLITLPDSNKVSVIEDLNGVQFYKSSKSATVTGFEFTQAGATVTVPTTFNGQQLEVTQTDVVSVPSVISRGLPRPVFGQFLMKQVTFGSTTLYKRAFKAQMTNGGYSSNNEGDVKTDLLTFLADNNGRFSQVGLA